MPYTMDDPTDELTSALPPLWRADAGVIAAFAPDPVRIYDVPPTSPPKAPYIILGLMQPLPLDGTDGANTEVTFDVWSLTEPPGTAKAKRIGAAALKAALGITDLTSHSVSAVLPTHAQYLTDPKDAVTAHGIVKFEIVTQPKP
jgi:hypothetical protein